MKSTKGLFVTAAFITLAIAMPSWAETDIPVGVLVAQSPPGSVTQGSQVLDGLKVAQKIINGNGGVLNEKIALKIQDTSGQPAKGNTGASRLINRDHVVAITGNHQSSVCLAAMEVAHKSNVPFVNTNCWANAIREKGYKNVFNPSPWNGVVVKAVTNLAKQLKVHKVVALAENTDFGIGQAKGLAKMMKKELPDVSYTYKVLDSKSHDFVTTLLKVKQSKPDMVVSIMLPPAGYQLLNQIQSQGIAPTKNTWLVEAAGITDYPDFWDNVTKAGKDIIEIGFYHPDMKLTKIGKEVAAAYTKKTGNPPSRLVFEAADSLFSIAHAIDEANSTEHKAVIKALSNQTFEGTRGKIKYSSKPGVSYHQWLDIPYVVYQYTKIKEPTKDTSLILGPGHPLDSSELKKPQ